MAPSPAPTSPNASSHPKELVDVSTALAVLSKVNLLNESRSLALDIGGSLAKLIYLQPYGTHTTSPPLVIHKVDGNVASALSVHVPPLRGTLHFFAFETGQLHQLLRFMRVYWGGGGDVVEPHRLIRATGGGSYKHEATFETEIGVKLVRLDEMACTVAGLNFLLTTVKDEVYVYIPQHPFGLRMSGSPAPPPSSTSNTTRFIDTIANPFPYLLVNIGSGVSIVKVTAHDTFERVSGSSLGGGTFWGLARLLLDCHSFDEIIRLTHAGDNANVDMLVGDIYGGAYESIGLDPSVIAASFGKATLRVGAEGARAESSSWQQLKARFMRAVDGSLRLWGDVVETLPGVGALWKALRGDHGKVHLQEGMGTDMRSHFRREDMALALLRMVSYNVGQIAYLNARLHNLDRIYFGGNFIRNHRYTVADIAFAVDFWSAGKTQALFLRHDGYLGAIGAFIGASRKAPARHALDAQEGEGEGTGEGYMEDLEAENLLGRPANPGHRDEENNGAMQASNGMVANRSNEEPRASPRANGTRKTKKRKKKKKNEKKNDGETDSATTSESPEMPGDAPPSSTSHSSGYAVYEALDALVAKAPLEAEWTTVTRVRRKGGSRDKAM